MERGCEYGGLPVNYADTGIVPLAGISATNIDNSRANITQMILFVTTPDNAIVCI